MTSLVDGVRQTQIPIARISGQVVDDGGVLQLALLRWLEALGVDFGIGFPWYIPVIV